MQSDLGSIRDAIGSLVTSSAMLVVSDVALPPSLRAVGSQSNSLTFELAGEVGRCYRIETSTNLVDWTPEKSFSLGRAATNLTSVIFTIDPTTILSLTNTTKRKFVRASVYHPDTPESQICINNLRQIRAAKLLNRRDEGQWVAYGYTPTLPDLGPYLPPPYQTLITRLSCPLCPDPDFLSSYTIADWQLDPLCLIDDSHLLEEQMY